MKINWPTKERQTSQSICDKDSRQLERSLERIGRGRASMLDQFFRGERKIGAGEEDGVESEETGWKFISLMEAGILYT